MKWIKKNKTENTFSLQSMSENLQYTNFPINRVHKFPKVEDTQAVQCPSFPNCQSPSYSKFKSPKAQVTQSPSCPNYQKSKLPTSKEKLLLSHDQEYLWLCNSHEYLWPCNSQKYFQPFHDKRPCPVPKFSFKFPSSFPPSCPQVFPKFTPKIKIQYGSPMAKNTYAQVSLLWPKYLSPNFPQLKYLWCFQGWKYTAGWNVWGEWFLAAN